MGNMCEPECKGLLHVATFCHSYFEHIHGIEELSNEKKVALVYVE